MPPCGGARWRAERERGVGLKPTHQPASAGASGRQHRRARFCCSPVFESAPLRAPALRCWGQSTSVFARVTVAMIRVPVYDDGGVDARLGRAGQLGDRGRPARAEAPVDVVVAGGDAARLLDLDRARRRGRRSRSRRSRPAGDRPAPAARPDAAAAPTGSRPGAGSRSRAQRRSAPGGRPTRARRRGGAARANRAARRLPRSPRLPAQSGPGVPRVLGALPLTGNCRRCNLN